MTIAAPVALRFQVGARTLWSLKRRLVRVSPSLADIRAGALPPLPPLPDDAHGYLVASVPEPAIEALVTNTDLRCLVRQRYTRRYADLAQGFDAYLASFSSKSRSTLLRKSRRFAERSGGALDVRAYRTPAEVGEFHRLARQVSALSYQEKLLDAGLPDGNAARAELGRLAAADRVRAFLLFLDGRPVSYLHLPANDDVLVYAHLGFDPAVSDLSPGGVLQLEALRLLMQEGRFVALDFTEGEGQHKRQFATGGVACADLLLLKPGILNRIAGDGLIAFDRAVARAKVALDSPQLRRWSRIVRR
ncbi:GNAT family N-acetyltransferase [Sphingomonas sp. 1P06PA]|uniref:GNAT family N-acetyltransferase n=1 Tax=Sphingomonas sp. 1P06PA TaxID=554121 RepID=UPI0039A44942